MQKLEFLKLLFNPILKQQQNRCVHFTVNLLKNDSNESKRTTSKYEELDQPLKSLNIKGLEDVGILKQRWSWPKYNRIVYPPQDQDDPNKVVPFVHHMRTYLRYSPKKLWYPAFMIRGMSVDEAITQLSFYRKKGAEIIKQTLLEAQDLAVKEHNIEFKSNLWVSYSNVGKAARVKGLRKHKATQYGIVKYDYSHYYVRLEEGSPPPDYHKRFETFDERAEKYIEYLRNREIHYGL